MPSPNPRLWIYRIYTTESIKIPHLSGSQSSSRLLTSWLLIVAKPRHAWHPVAVSHITLHIKPTVSPGVPSLSVLLPMAMLVAPTRVTLPDCQCACSLAEPESWMQASHDVSLNILMWSKLYPYEYQRHSTAAAATVL
jgi:hypothetical protein